MSMINTLEDLLIARGESGNPAFVLHGDDWMTLRKEMQTRGFDPKLGVAANRRVYYMFNGVPVFEGRSVLQGSYGLVEQHELIGNNSNEG